MKPAMTEPDAAAPSPAPYPTELVRAVVLKNGAHVRIRPIRPDDEPRLVELYGRLSRYTVYQRFFTVMRRLPPDWAHFFANVDYRRRLALVAERDTPTGVELVGVGRYEPGEEPDTAEVAFVIEDGRGGDVGAVRAAAGGYDGLTRWRRISMTAGSTEITMIAKITTVKFRLTTGMLPKK